MTTVIEYGEVLAQTGASSSTTMIVVGLLGVAAIVVGLANLYRDVKKGESKRVDDRLMGVTRAKGGKSVDQVRASLVKKSAIAAGGGVIKMLGGFKPIAKLQQACYQADLDWNAPRLVMRAVFAGVLAVFLLMVSGFDILRAGFVGAVIIFGPIMYIQYLKKRRLNKLIEQLPEVFDALVAALRAGQSLPAAIGLVAEQVPEPAHTEFSMVYQEQNLGVPIEDALGNMRTRLNQMDVSFFVTAVQVQKQTGGDLAEVLASIGEVIRARIKLFGQVAALTAEGRLSGWVLMALPPIMLFVLLFLNPDYANRLLETELGHKLLWGAAISQFFGLLMIKKIVEIEV